jgi:exonuclease III
MGRSLRVASFNVNGIRARLPLLLNWLQKEEPDVVCLQETKKPRFRTPSFLGRLWKVWGLPVPFEGKRGSTG